MYVRVNNEDNGPYAFEVWIGKTIDPRCGLITSEIHAYCLLSVSGKGNR